MTSRGKSNQGEGYRACETGLPHPTPKAWAQTLLYPMQCVRCVVTIHQQAGQERYSVTVEVDDPHTRELVSMTSNPTARRSSIRSIAAAVAIDVRAALEAALDPDPF